MLSEKWRLNGNLYYTSVFFILMAVFISLAFSIRFVNSTSVVLLAFAILLRPDRTSLIKQAFKDHFFISSLCFVLINLAGLLYTNNVSQNLKEFSVKAGMISVSLFFCADICRGKINLRQIMTIFTACLAAATLYCIFNALYIYLVQRDSSSFFYHNLVKPFNEHAVYYSFYLLFCFIYWNEEGITTVDKAKKKIAIISILIYFFIVIILLSSKIVLGILLVYLLYFIPSRLVKKRNKKIFFLMVGVLSIILFVLAATNNPVKKRFSDMAAGTSTLFQQEKFTPGVYFNGLQFRLLTWRFTSEILNEQKSWLLGVSPGDGKEALQKKYVETNMYQGDGINSQGYLQYDCHNVYLETILESGLIGLVSLLSLIITFLIKIMKSKSRTALIFFISMLIFGFTESYLSRQYGIVLFTFLPLLALSNTNSSAIK
ncbi:MAG TPA: O-antigen ligase family protein [Agriterribacter sp.]|nr:O-antigen ligase family protein [Agriterribacter sp.]